LLFHDVPPHPIAVLTHLLADPKRTIPVRPLIAVARWLPKPQIRRGAAIH